MEQVRGPVRILNTRTRPFAFLVIAYRTVGLVAALIGYLGLPGRARGVNNAIIVVSIATITLNVVLIPLIISPLFQTLRTRWIACLDISVAIGLNLWEAAELEPHQLFNGAADVFTILIISAVALWTFTSGWRIGAFIVWTFALIQLPMAMLNGYHIANIAWAVAAGRVVWASLGILAGEGVRRVSDEVERLVQQKATRRWRSQGLGTNA